MIADLELDFIRTIFPLKDIECYDYDSKSSTNDEDSIDRIENNIKFDDEFRDITDDDFIPSPASWISDESNDNYQAFLTGGDACIIPPSFSPFQQILHTESQQRHQQIPFPQVHQIPQAIPTNNGTNDSSDDDGDTKPVKPRSRKQTADHTIGKKPVTKRRRRSNLMKPGSQLYQFILQLLDDENKRDLIRWEERQRGIFRIMKKEQVAKMWGEARNRPMSYDSLSRGLRHYYHQGLLNAVNKKLHYQFTEKALEEWEVIRHKDSIEDR